MTRIYYEHKYKKWVDEVLNIAVGVCFGEFWHKPNLPIESKIDDLCYDMDDNLEMCVIEFIDEHPNLITPILRAFIDGYCLAKGADLEDFV
jgi:hypothetical protein